MKRSTIAIVGNGYIAGNLKRFLEMYYPNYSVVSYGRQKTNDAVLDLFNPEQFSYEILDSIDYVIFAAAISSPDVCANEYESAYQVNVIGTSSFIEKALMYNCKVIFLSSDAVFGFVKDTVDENSNTFEDTPYGAMKKTVEDQFKSSPNFKALRLSYVISSDDKFSKYLKKCHMDEEIAEVYSPFDRCCITLSELLDTIIYLIKEWKSFSSSFLNVCGNQLISRERIVEEWNLVYKGQLKYKVIEAPTTFFDNRPAILKMNSLYLHNILDSVNETFHKRFENEIITMERMNNR